MKKLLSLVLVIAMILTFACAKKTGHIEKDAAGNEIYIKADDSVAKNEWVEIDNKWYYFGPNGLKTFNTMINGEYYVGDDGSMVANYWYKDPTSGTYFYFGDDGAIIKNSWVKSGDDWFYLDENGMMATSKWIDNTYYVDATGKMEKNTVTPDGYIVGADGKYVALPPTGAETPVAKPAQPVSAGNVVETKPAGPFKYKPVVGQSVVFGKYQGQKIQWVVLDVKPGRALCFSKQILDYKKYNETFVNTTWATSTMRVWLNFTFLNQAFSANDRSCIFSTSIITPKNTKTEMSGGSGTRDSVFLLSTDEVNAYSTLLNNQGLMLATSTTYAKKQTVNPRNTSWFLRTPGTNLQQVCFVTTEGSIDYSGAAVDLNSSGVRPAVWVLY